MPDNHNSFSGPEYVYGWGRTKHLRDKDSQYEKGLCGASGGHPDDEKRPVCKTCLRIAGEDILLRHSGRIYVRPVGRGICLIGPDGEFQDDQLEDQLPDGYYTAEIIIRSAPQDLGDSREMV